MPKISGKGAELFGDRVPGARGDEVEAEPAMRKPRSGPELVDQEAEQDGDEHRGQREDQPGRPGRRELAALERRRRGAADERSPGGVTGSRSCRECRPGTAGARHGHCNGLGHGGTISGRAVAAAARSPAPGAARSGDRPPSAGPRAGASRGTSVNQPRPWRCPAASSGTSSQVNEEIGYASSPGALVIDTRKSVSDLSRAPAAAAVTLLSDGLDELLRPRSSAGVGQAVDDGVDQLDVADRALGLLDLLGDTFVALAAQTDRPLRPRWRSRPSTSTRGRPWTGSR